MPFRPVTPEKIAAAIVRQIETLILRGVLRPGERLPAERDLAARLDVSRPTLREALAELEANGLIETRPNAGAYVAEVLGSAFAPPLVRLFARHNEALFDYITFRKDLEGMSAERAARFGGETDLRVITTVFARMETAHQKRSPREEADLDADFHMSIVEAAHNVVMLHMVRSMFEMLKAGVFYNRQSMFGARTTRADLLSQHREIHDAILARDPTGARAAAEAHLNYVERTMQSQLQYAVHEETALLRFRHAQAQ